jgi:serine O-acetyltransferase
LSLVARTPSTTACACTNLREVVRKDIFAAIQPGATRVNWLKVAVVLVSTPRHQAMIEMRCAHWLHVRGRKLMARFVQAHIQRISGADVHPGAHIGGGLVIAHSVGIVVGERVVAGENLRLHQSVTLGERGDGPAQPVLGDDVNIGAGAVVIGGVRLGNGVVVGANAVVTKDVEADAVVVGAAARRLDAVRI